MTKVFVVANSGFDYEWPEVLAICSTETRAKEILSDLKGKRVFQWNQRSYVEIELDILISAQQADEADEAAAS